MSVRRLLARACLLVGLVVIAGLAVASPAGAASQGTTKAEAIDQLQNVRSSINTTLTLFKQGKDAAALKQSQSGYLNHFEYVEIPLRVADPQFTLDAETKFAEVRQ